MKLIDLHTHSTFSDGTLTPKQLSEYAAKKGLSAYALTDHDTVSGMEEARFYAEGNNVELIPGVEISADYNGKEIHIVGLFIDVKNEELLGRLKTFKEKRTQRNHSIIKKFNSLGIDITYDDVFEESGKKVITRAHFAKQLIKKGYASSLSDCFEKYLNKGKPAYVERELLSTGKAINLIKSSGGIAILAHPLYYKLSDVELNDMLASLASGLTAMECYYSTHSAQQTSYTLDLCGKYNLLVSGGSDFHGENKPGLDLGSGYGSLAVRYEILEDLKEAAKNGKRLD